MGRQLVARYDLETRIGTGGMGAVWQATDVTLNRAVAVKLLDLDETAIPDAADRFVREAQIAASLSHPNIVRVFDYGIDQSTAFIVMELLAGPTLAERLAQEGPMGLDPGHKTREYCVRRRQYRQGSRFWSCSPRGSDDGRDCSNRRSHWNSCLLSS
jgi:serine/threonine protein kinase